MGMLLHMPGIFLSMHEVNSELTCIISIATCADGTGLLPSSLASAFLPSSFARLLALCS